MQLLEHRFSNMYACKYIYIYIYVYIYNIYIYLEPVCPLFLEFNPLTEGPVGGLDFEGFLDYKGSNAGCQPMRPYA